MTDKTFPATLALNIVEINTIFKLIILRKLNRLVSSNLCPLAIRQWAGTE